MSIHIFGFIAWNESMSLRTPKLEPNSFCVNSWFGLSWFGIGKRRRGVRRRHHNDGSGESTSVCHRKRAKFPRDFFRRFPFTSAHVFFFVFFCVRETKLVLLLRIHIEFQNSTKSCRFFRDASGLRFHRIHEADTINIAVFPLAWLGCACKCCDWIWRNAFSRNRCSLFVILVSGIELRSMILWFCFCIRFLRSFFEFWMEFGFLVAVVVNETNERRSNAVKNGAFKHRHKRARTVCVCCSHDSDSNVWVVCCSFKFFFLFLVSFPSASASRFDEIVVVVPVPVAHSGVRNSLIRLGICVGLCVCVLCGWEATKTRASFLF